MSDKPQQPSSDRRLAAIMFTDIVGYTSLMQKDEGMAVDTIERHRFILEKYTREYHGNILQYYGDGSLSIFPSAFEAVECALKIQKELTQDPVVPLRIGIHLGDVKIQGESVFGDGVNMASRIESLGVGGSILITDTIYHLVKNQSIIKTILLGNFRLKNVDHPVPVYALSSDFLSVPKTDELRGRIKSLPGKYTWIGIIAIIMILILIGYALSRFFSLEIYRFGYEDKSIAVIPFNNLSNDPQQEYFSDGITDDIINHLAKVSELKVKSRTTTEQYRNPDKTIPVIGRELGVSYILEGSVRKAENKVRIVAQLIDVKNDVHVWTETFDREITAIFDIQSDIAIEIAQVLEARLTSDEMRYIRGEPRGRGRSIDMTAYDYSLRARRIWRNWNDENDLENALQLIEQAIEMDPLFARGYVLKGNILHYGMRSLGEPIQVWIDQAVDMAEKAISLDSTLAEAYLLRGNIYRNLEGKAEKAKNDLKKACHLEPGNPDVLQSLGSYYQSLGEYELGASLIIRSIERGYSLMDPEYYLRWGGIYASMMDEYGKAEELYRKAISLAPGWINPYYYLGQLYRYWGKLDMAEEIVSEALEISPMDQENIDLLGWINLLDDNLEEAARYWSMYEELEQQFTDSSQYVPFRHRLGYVQYLLGDTVSAINLIEEQLTLDLERHQNLRGYGAWQSRGYYYDLAGSYAYLGNQQEALMWLDSAYQQGFINLWYMENDPLLRNIRNTTEFRRIKNNLVEREQKRKSAFIKAIEENKDLPAEVDLFLHIPETETD
jgi:TolB-like protein/class 3 adenylate cyclase/Flp pilus assembly protein TadD